MKVINFIVGQKYENIRAGEICEVIRITEKTVFFKAISEYCTVEIKKSILNVTNLVKIGQWELVN
jgi:hypothetical protein